jgi:hypothetical protein
MWRAFRRSEKDECSKTRELLSGYMDQRLNPEEVAHVEGHLRTCPGCREEMESLRATVALLHRLPEVTPSRSFAVSPVRPLPGRRALPALRFATAGVVLLLVLAFAADQTNVVEKKEQTGSYLGMASESGGDGAYWLVEGERNEIADPDAVTKTTEVNLVVPDGSDNVVAAVNLLASGDAIYGNLVAEEDNVLQLVLTEGEEEAGSRGNAEEFAVVSDSGETQNRFAPNDAAVSSEVASIMKEQDGPHLNIMNSDNSVLYSFDLSLSTLETKVARDNDWLRSLEYGLIGLVVVLGGATAALWLRQKRQREVGVIKSQN